MLSFSDGTQIRMAAEARGRVVEVTKHGGRIALDEGALTSRSPTARARVDIRSGAVPRQRTGTTFSLGWDLKQSRFDIQMEEGVVSVTGPVTGGDTCFAPGRNCR